MSLKSGLKYKTDFQLTRGFLIGNNSNWELSWKVDFKLIETYMLKKKYEKKTFYTSLKSVQFFTRSIIFETETHKVLLQCKYCNKKSIIPHWMG